MAKSKRDRNVLAKDATWYKHAVIYELHVRAFHDSNGDGVGDLRGLTEKLDYLQELGITALWLLPFYPSPLKDDGYDISDYYSIHPAYGTLSDFKVFLREAHRRGLRVITELVVNHTSDEHPWFRTSRRSKPGSRWRDFYVWSDTATEYRDARIIFKDFETSNWSWDPVANAYFWHRFYSHQPDLNYDNPAVHREIFKAVDFWFDLGVDGLRLDAVPYLYEREGTNCENLPETHEFLKKLRRHVDEKFEDRMLLAEANQWPEDAVAYFGSGTGDECHMAFHFPLMPRLFMGVRMEDRVPIVDILQQTPPIPATTQWALFLRNHDELTLEMVTDEERDYMYRVYAHDERARINLGIRRRLAPLMGNDRRRIELLNALLLSLPGTPVIYYGDEIAMGENIYLGDRNGVRTPMQWSSDRNAGFSKANPQKLYLPVIVDPENHYETNNVESQQMNSLSFLWWMKRLLTLRKRWHAFGEGTLEFLHPENRHVLAFTRSTRDQTVLVVANLSRFAQPVELDLSPYANLVPVELFGRTPFPAVSEDPYRLTLGPHAFYWLSLESEPDGASSSAVSGELPTLHSPVAWEESLDDEKLRTRLERPLLAYIKARRWFGRRAKSIKSMEIEDVIPVSVGNETVFIALASVDHVQGDTEHYLLPLAFASEEAERDLLRDFPGLAVARLQLSDPLRSGIVYDAVGNDAFCEHLLGVIGSRRHMKGERGSIVGSHTKVLTEAVGKRPSTLEVTTQKMEQSNSVLVYEDRLILKLFRSLGSGLNPALEIGRFLTQKKFPSTPRVAGSLEYRKKGGEVLTVGILHEFIPDSRDAWAQTLDVLGRFYDRVTALPEAARDVPALHARLLDLVGSDLPDHVNQRLGLSEHSAKQLGQRTAELHLTLASNTQDEEFAPEPFTPHYQRSLFQSMRNLTVRVFGLLRGHTKAVPANVRELVQEVQGLESTCLDRFRRLVDRKIRASRIRCHGDLHLRQVLYTGKDYYIIDFEGDPARAVSERRIKRCPLRDVTGLLHSYHHAAQTALRLQVERGSIGTERLEQVEPWARYWSGWMGVIYLQSYLSTVRQGGFLPAALDELRVLLDAFLLERAIRELGHELHGRLDRLEVPLRSIQELLSIP